MLAVHFGAGNIGRGFIGMLLQQSGYDVCFVDVNEELVSLLNERKEYTVVLANQEQTETVVTGVSALNSAKNRAEVLDKIAQADLITTAVGPTVLGIIAPMLAEGLKKRVATSGQPLNIIACENMIGGSSFLQEKVFEHVSDEEKAQFNEVFAFPNSAVDRIVPNQTNDDKLMVKVEPFYEWVVEQTNWKGNLPDIMGAHFVDDLAPFIERKLFTVNTGHAAIAYMGALSGHHYIADAIKDANVHEVVSGALQESGKVLVKTYGFTSEQHQAYIDKILGRFQNEYIVDDVKRVGRSPIRKLGAKDRLFSPALAYYQHFNEVPEQLCAVIAAALSFQSEDDQEAVELQKLIEEKGKAGALAELTGLEVNHPIIEKAANGQ